MEGVGEIRNGVSEKRRWAKRETELNNIEINFK